MMKKTEGRRVMKTPMGRRVLTAVLTLVLLGSLAGMGYRQLQYREGEKVYQEADELVQLPDLETIETVPVEEKPVEQQPAASESAAAEEPAPVYVDPYAQALADMDFVALREQNTDVLGWILIPNTKIS